MLTQLNRILAPDPLLARRRFSFANGFPACAYRFVSSVRLDRERVVKTLAPPPSYFSASYR